MMLKCWSESAKSRPSFSELCEELDAILSTETAQVIMKYFLTILNHFLAAHQFY